MSKIGKCDVCGIIFPDIGDLESEVRVRHHMKTPHVVPCAKCDKKFVSTAHQVFHQYSRMSHYAHTAINYAKGDFPVCMV